MVLILITLAIEGINGRLVWTKKAITGTDKLLNQSAGTISQTKSIDGENSVEKIIGMKYGDNNVSPRRMTAIKQARNRVDCITR